MSLTEERFKMLETILPLAYGPVGGIDPSVAVFWVVVWTVILGGSLYASLFVPAWLEPDYDRVDYKH